MHLTYHYEDNTTWTHPTAWKSANGEWISRLIAWLRDNGSPVVAITVS